MKIQVSDQRESDTCVYCRDSLGEDPYECPGCAARLHSDCREQLDRCPTLGCDAGQGRVVVDLPRTCSRCWGTVGGQPVGCPGCTSVFHAHCYETQGCPSSDCAFYRPPLERTRPGTGLADVRRGWPDSEGLHPVPGGLIAGLVMGPVIGVVDHQIGLVVHPGAPSAWACAGYGLLGGLLLGFLAGLAVAALPMPRSRRDEESHAQAWSLVLTVVTLLTLALLGPLLNGVTTSAWGRMGSGQGYLFAGCLGFALSWVVGSVTVGKRVR